MKRKIFIPLFVSLSIIIIAFIPGCGGGNSSSSGNPSIVFVQTSGTGGVGFNMSSMNGIVFAAGGIEIGSEYVLYMLNNSEGQINGIDVYYKDASGNRLTDAVQLDKDFSGSGDNDCFDILNAHNNESMGGTQAQIAATNPGRANIIATCKDVTRIIQVYTYDSYGLVPGSAGISLVNGIKALEGSGNQANCAFYADNAAKVHITGKSYLVDTADELSWRAKLRAIKSIDTSKLGSVDTLLLPDGKIYIAEVPTGGYMKIIWTGYSKIWEWIPAAEAAQGFK